MNMTPVILRRGCCRVACISKVDRHFKKRRSFFKPFTLVSDLFVLPRGFYLTRSHLRLLTAKTNWTKILFRQNLNRFRGNRFAKNKWRNKDNREVLSWFICKCYCKYWKSQQLTFKNLYFTRSNSSIEF